MGIDNVSDLKERRFKFARVTYSIRFTQNALMRLQAQVGEPLQDYLGRIFNPNGVRVSNVELQHLLWAGLEGSRLKDRARRGGRAWDIFEVGDLMENVNEDADGMVFDVDAGETANLSTLIVECFVAGFANQLPKDEQAETLDEKEASKAAEEAAPKDPTKLADGDTT